MTKRQKEQFNEIVDELNEVKDRMARVSDELMDAGMYKEAEQLMRLVYKVEAFQNKVM